MNLPILGILLTVWTGAVGQAPQDRPLLAMEVRFHGDAEPWRWWCRAPEDPLAEDVIQGFAEGFRVNQQELPIVALPQDTAAVHPMYCTEPLDNDLATNLAGLLDASVNHSGLLEISAIVEHAEPRLLTTEISFFPLTEGVFSSPKKEDDSDEEDEEDSPGDGSQNPGENRLAPLVSRTAVAATPDKLSSALREAARSVGRTVYLLRLKKMKARGSDRQLWFYVRGLTDGKKQQDLAARLQALFPSGFEMTVLGFKGDSSAFVLEAPQGKSSDLLGMLQARIGASTAGLPPLLLEGFDETGVPLFVTVDSDTASQPSSKDPMFP